MRRVLFFRRSLPAKENMTPAGLAPAPVAVFTCSREARRLIKSGLKAAHRSLSGPREVEKLILACDRATLDGSRILPTHTIKSQLPTPTF